MKQEIAKLRLHLGCGEVYLEDYVNVDYPSTEHSVMDVAADIYTDIRTLEYPENSVDEIRNHHFFEHFTRAEALAFLVRWHNWLKPGGELVIEVPDFGKCARAFTFALGNKRRMELGRHMMGSQEAPWAYHYDFWDGRKFRRTLSRLGYARVRTRSIMNSFAKHYSKVPCANIIGNLIPDSVYKKRGGHKLPSIRVTAQKKETAIEHRAVVKELLSEYLVGREGDEMLLVWMGQFDNFGKEI